MRARDFILENPNLEEVDRRGFLRGLAAFAAASAMPSDVVSALATPEGIRSMSVGDVSSLIKAIQDYLPPYDQQDWTGTFERWDKMAEALHIPDGDLDAADKLDRLMRQYRRDPDAASTKLLKHLQKHAVDLTDVRGQTISQWDDVKTVSKSDPVNAEIRQMQKQIADYNARMRRQKQTHIGQAQTAVTAATAFRNLVQRVIDAGAGAAAAPPREKYMGRINPVSSAPALPAPDRSAAEIMAQLRDVVGRDLTDAEREVVAQEVSRTNKQREPDVQEARLHREEDLFKTGGFLSNRRIDTDLLRLRPLDNRFALWQDQHLRQIAHEQEYIGEEFPDWTTSGIVDRETGEPVAVIMYTDGWSSPFPDSVEISQVEVDPQYRGQGLARYLYSLLRRQHNIVSDQDQSPGGAAMWVRMAREGIPVQGWVHFNGNRSPAELDASYDGKYDYEGQLKKLGAREVPGGGRSPLYVFPVKEQNGRLDNLAGTTIRVYQGDFINHWESGLVAPKG